MKVRDILRENGNVGPEDDFSIEGPFNISNGPAPEEEEAGKQYCLYFDYTGAGRGPEPVAGPFSTEQEAEDYAEENGYVNNQYFVDVYRE